MKFEEEPIPDFELAPGECSSPQPFEDVSDDTCSIFSDTSDINMDEDDIFVYDSPSSPKWDEKIVQAVEELEGNPHEPRKTRSQTRRDYFASDSALVEKFYMIVGTDPHLYNKYFNYPIWISSMEEEFQSLQKNNTWELVPLPPKRKVVQRKWVYRTKLATDG